MGRRRYVERQAESTQNEQANGQPRVASYPIGRMKSFSTRSYRGGGMVLRSAEVSARYNGSSLSASRSAIRRGITGSAFANDDCQTFVREIFGVKRRIEAADDDGDASGSERPGQSAGVRRTKVHRRQEDGVDVHLEIDVPHHLVDEQNVPVPRQQRRNVGTRVRRHLARAGEGRRYPVVWRFPTALPGWKVFRAPDDYHRCTHTCSLERSHASSAYPARPRCRLSEGRQYTHRRERQPI